MTKLETSELCLIFALTLFLGLGGVILPSSLSLGRIILFFSALLLFQGLVRDVSLLIRDRHITQDVPAKAAHCLCMESSIGILGVTLGLFIWATGVQQSLTMTSPLWSLIILLVLLFGFFIKDYVIAWKPLHIRKEKDHLNLIVRW